MSPPAEGGQCPICGKPRDQKFKPFCSKRCADIDLSKWLKGEYSIPGAPIEEGEDPPIDPEASDLN
ncbi:MAG: DNA gyrase inhibitor YacG [Alphaproteobacteria bacterium]|nr:DNA gyrase inhibitor YacG [Alphaproteobacteria bacterium]